MIRTHSETLVQHVEFYILSIFSMYNITILKMMKNAFYFTLKALFVLEIFNFCLEFLDKYKNGLIRKVRLISKFITSQSGEEQLQ